MAWDQIQNQLRSVPWDEVDWVLRGRIDEDVRDRVGHDVWGRVEAVFDVRAVITLGALCEGPKWFSGP